MLSSSPIMIRASEPPIKARRSGCDLPECNILFVTIGCRSVGGGSSIDDFPTPKPDRAIGTGANPTNA